MKPNRMIDETPDTVDRVAAMIEHKHTRVPHELRPANLDIRGVRASLSEPFIEKEDAPLDGHGLFKALISRMPYDLQMSFNQEQLTGIRQAAEQLRWGRHPLDLRASVPLPFFRIYLAVIAGVERRSIQRDSGVKQTGSSLGACLQLCGIVALVWVAATLVSDLGLF